jgi:rubredoxin
MKGTHDMKCPNCGEDKHLYRNVEVFWMPELGAWKLAYLDAIVECTHCDHSFDYEGTDNESF